MTPPLTFPLAADLFDVPPQGEVLLIVLEGDWAFNC